MWNLEKSFSFKKCVNTRLYRWANEKLQWWYYAVVNLWGILLKIRRINYNSLRCIGITILVLELRLKEPLCETDLKHIYLCTWIRRFGTWAELREMNFMIILNFNWKSFFTHTKKSKKSVTKLQTVYIVFFFIEKSIYRVR